MAGGKENDPMSAGEFYPRRGKRKRVGAPTGFLIWNSQCALKSKTGVMVASDAALHMNINTDGCPIPTKNRWEMSNKVFAHHLLPRSEQRQQKV